MSATTQHTMKIKVCGMREGRNIRAVEALGIDMMGFICWPGSARHVEEVPTYLPQCERVGVFVNPSLEYVVQQVANLQLHRIQLHGAESAEFCREVHNATGMPITKAIAVHTKDDIERYRQYLDATGVDLLLFDTKCPCVGGSGIHFDWDILHAYDGSLPFMLAGGIGPDDAERVKAFSHPRMMGIDINSRFEQSPAVKDVALLQQFMNKLQQL